MKVYMNIVLKIIGLSLLPLALLANGGPSDVSLIQRTGNIHLVNKENISLDAEDLHIEIDGDFVNVRVNYTLTNHGPADTVSYAFPVDWSDEFGMIEWQYPDGWEAECIPYIRMFDDEGELDIRKTDARDSIKVDLYNYEYQKSHETYFHRRWYTIQLAFPENATRHLVVSYRVKAAYEDFTTNKSYRTGYGPRVFSYDLNPSSHWGNGVVGSFTLTLDARDQLLRGMIIDTLLLPGVTMLQDGVYYYHTTDFNLASAEDILIVFDNGVPNQHQTLARGRIGPGQLVSIRASSQGGDGYGVTNLIDGDPSTAWVEGAPGDGEGEWIEVEFRDFVPHAIGILNGYTKSEETYYQNNRVKRCEVEFIDPDGNRVTVSQGDGYGDGHVFERDFEAYNPDSPWAFASFIFMAFPDNQSSFSSGKIRITISATYPGTRYDDTCISELIIWHAEDWN